MSTNDTKEDTKTSEIYRKPDSKLRKGSQFKVSGAEHKSKVVPVVAVGASAGGLEPIKSFFDFMPSETGCAFVIIQHLSPDFPSLMDELLAPHTSMKIHNAKDGMEIEPNSIYLNSPRSFMTVDENCLRVEDIVDQDNTGYLPIDLFFVSLASSHGKNAMGLVLSGTGSDGTRGARSIKKLGGNILVQDPATTRFNGMPNSAIADGDYEIVAAPGELARFVVQILHNQPIEVPLLANREPLEEPLHDLLSMLKHRYGTDFQQYKEATVKRRIERRAQINCVTEINDYRELLNTDELELEILYADLLIEVTEFFRDIRAFDIIRNQVLPRLMQDFSDGGSFRVWVPGCASGEEAYSLAILVMEQARVMGLQLNVKILATDIHVRSMSKASTGIYNESSLTSVPADLKSRYFDISDGKAQVKPIIRNVVFFSTHDVMRDPPFTRMNIVSCRNLLIYLKDEAQENVLNILHFALRKNGFLFLGPSEHIQCIPHEFEIFNQKWRIFKKRRDVQLPEEVTSLDRDTAEIIPLSDLDKRHAPQSIEAMMGKEQSILVKRAQRIVVEEIVAKFAPPGFLLTEDGTVVHTYGSAGSLLPMQVDSFSRNIVDLIRPDLKVIVKAALDQTKSGETSEFRQIEYVKESDESSVAFEVSLRPIELANETPRFLLLSILEKTQSVGEQSVTPTEVQKFVLDESSEGLRQTVLALEHSLSSSENKLQAALCEVSEKNLHLEVTLESLNKIVLVASHDLQEPLRKIKQFSSFLEEDLGESLNEDGRYHMNVIVDASQRMSTLIRDFHGFLGFFGTTRLEDRLETVKLEPLLAQVIEALELPEDEHTINVDFEKLQVIHANRLMLNQMLVNLLSNSVMYRADERPLVVSIVSTSKNGIGTIEVSDNGIGFDRQFAHKIFEPFNRLHNAQQFKGSGIGLAICQTICDKHGWSISAEGEPDKGSKFIVTMNNECVK